MEWILGIESDRRCLGSIVPRLAPALLLAALLAQPATGQGSVWHVRAGAPPGGDGLTWATAFAALDDGFAAAQDLDQVWVAEGTYVPTQRSVPNDPRTAVFDLPDQVDVYGGFAGFETSLVQRAGLFDTTVLSGDVGVPGDASDNAYRVVRFASDADYHAMARLDGFRITGGRGEVGNRGGGVHLTSSQGAGSWAILFLANCRIEDNSSERGGGIAIDNLCRMKMLRCSIVGNRAALHGGGLFTLTGWIWSHNSVWHDNTAGQDGGAVFAASNENGSARFVNGLFHDNRAGRGGAVFLASDLFFHGSTHLLDCTVAYNQAAHGGAVFAEGASMLKVRNSILWGNRAQQHAQVFPVTPTSTIEFAYSIVQDGYSGAYVLPFDPMFVDPAQRDLHTLPGSPGHDSANDALLPHDQLDLDGDGDVLEPIPFDLDDARRLTEDPAAPNSGTGTPPPDMGAYEHQH